MYFFLILSGRWRVKDVQPNPNGESQEVKIKVRINQNGIVLISNATMVDKKDAVEQENGDGATEPTPVEPMEQEVSIQF